MIALEESVAGMNKFRAVVLALMIPVMIGGLIYAFWPAINGAVLSAEYTAAAQNFMEEQNESTEDHEGTDGDLFPELRTAMQDLPR